MKQNKKCYCISLSGNNSSSIRLLRLLLMMFMTNMPTTTIVHSLPMIDIQDDNDNDNENNNNNSHVQNDISINDNDYFSDYSYDNVNDDNEYNQPDSCFEKCKTKLLNNCYNENKIKIQFDFPVSYLLLGIPIAVLGSYHFKSIFKQIYNDENVTKSTITTDNNVIITTKTITSNNTSVINDDYESEIFYLLISIIIIAIIVITICVYVLIKWICGIVDSHSEKNDDITTSGKMINM